jgi:hypothetical protein
MVFIPSRISTTEIRTWSATGEKIEFSLDFLIFSGAPSVAGLGLPKAPFLVAERRCVDVRPHFDPACERGAPRRHDIQIFLVSGIS